MCVRYFVELVVIKTIESKRKDNNVFFLYVRYYKLKCKQVKDILNKLHRIKSRVEAYCHVLPCAEERVIKFMEKLKKCSYSLDRNKMRFDVNSNFEVRRFICMNKAVTKIQRQTMSKRQIESIECISVYYSKLFL